MFSKFPSKKMKKKIIEHLGFLFEDLGFELRLNPNIPDGTYYIAQTINTSLHIYRERTSEIVCEIKPRGSSSEDQIRKQGYFPELVPLAFVGLCFDDKYKNYKYTKNLDEALKGYAEILKKYCMNFFKGDYSEWDVIGSRLNNNRAKRKARSGIKNATT